MHIKQAYNRGALSLEFAMKGKQISYYQREDKLNTGGQVTALIYSLSQSYNIGKNITWDQAGEIAEAILKNYWHLKLAELFLFVENAKQGKYGKAFDRLDMAVILEWLDTHCLEREAELERQHTNKKHDQELPTTGRDVLNGLIEKFPDTAENLKAIGTTSKPLPEVSIESRDAKNKLIQIQELRTWFPKELNRLYHVAEYRFDRWGKPCTVDYILESRQARNLKARIHQLKNPNRYA